MQFESNKRCLKYLRFATILLASILFLLCTLFLSFIPKLMISLNIIFILAAVFVVFIYLPVFFKNLSYIIFEDRIIKQSGFFFIKKQIMLFEPIQYSTSFSTPFNILTGLNFYMLYAYGGIMTLMFLTKDCEEYLNKHLGKKGKNVS